jgi:hypothetical protein
MRTALVAVAALALAACATPYQKMGFRGGYEDTRVDETTFIVEFSGNAFVSRGTVDTYIHYRCAELTLEAGYDYFVVLKDVAGGGMYGTASYGSVSVSEKPASTVHIKIFKGKKPDDPYAYDAREIIRVVGPKVGKQPETKT